MSNDFDWDAIDQAIEEAHSKTTTNLADRLSSVTRLRQDEIQALFPKKADAERLNELMKIVRSTDSRNQKVNRLASNIQELGGTVLTLLDALG